MYKQEEGTKYILKELEGNRKPIKSFIKAMKARFVKIDELNYTVLELQHENNLVCQILRKTLWCSV